MPKVILHKSSIIHKNHYKSSNQQNHEAITGAYLSIPQTKTVDAMKYAIFMQINKVHTLEQLQYCSRGPRSDVEGVSLFATCIHLSTYERE